MKNTRADKPCYCGTEQPYENCCAAFIEGKQSAPSAETLMRSRYSAYAQHNEDYILSTWHASTRPQSLSINSDSPVKWIRLKVISSSYDTVEFIAWYKHNGKAHQLHELSRFIFEDQRWYYLDGDTAPTGS